MNDSHKKVLIITYYWPPSGGSGVQRWLKFVKYLPSFGWRPYIFTPKNPSFDIKDETLFRDVPPEATVIHYPIWEPYNLFLSFSKIFGGSKSAKPTELVKTKKSQFQKLATWIRGNWFIPDPRKFWVKPSVNFLAAYLDKEGITSVITTGPPHSIHLIGLQLKKHRPKLKWIADFRDPWSEWGLLDSLNVGPGARRKHKLLEKEVLTNADEIVTITPFYARQFSKLAGRDVRLLTNGFDTDDFKGIKYSTTDKFTIRHVGIVNEKCNPRPFMTAVSELIRENPETKNRVVVEFIGEVHPDFKAFVETDELLDRHTRFAGNIPHKQLLDQYGSADVLLIVLTGYKDAEGYMPGKLFEYMATGLPIVGTGPEDGDAARLLRDSGVGVMFDANKTTEIKAYLLKEFKLWSAGSPKQNRSVGGEQYSRRSITAELVLLLEPGPGLKSPS